MKGLTMLDDEKNDWCIVRWESGDLLVLMRFQLEARLKREGWQLLADGFKSNEEALQWVKLFKE